MLKEKEKAAIIGNMDTYRECPHCHKMTPSEELNCIHCGEVLPEPAGLISSIIYRFKWIALIIAAVLILAFIAYGAWL